MTLWTCKSVAYTALLLEMSESVCCQFKWRIDLQRKKEASLNYWPLHVRTTAAVPVQEPDMSKSSSAYCCPTRNEVQKAGETRVVGLVKPTCRVFLQI
jgi:hypothetical protein